MSSNMKNLVVVRQGLNASVFSLACGRSKHEAEEVWTTFSQT